MRINSVSLNDIITQSISNPIDKSNNISKKWIRFLKNKKLFDEYIIYLTTYGIVGITPKTYEEVSNICYNLSYYNNRFGSVIVCGNKIKIDWIAKFYEFCKETIKWYNVKEIFLYLIKNGYKN